MIRIKFQTAMDILYKNKVLERLLILTNVAVTTAVVGTALLQLGFYRQILPLSWMYLILVAATVFFIAEKFIRFFNVRSKKDFLSLWWYEFLFVAVLLILLFTTDFLIALAVYLLLIELFSFRVQCSSWRLFTTNIIGRTLPPA